MSVNFFAKLTEGKCDHVAPIGPPAGCYRDNKISWYHMIQWLFYLLGTELSVGVCILYWVLLYRGEEVSHVSFHTHLVNGIFGLIEIWICGIPTNTLHVIYVMAFGTAYTVFTGLYYAGSGKVLYSVLDYKNSLSSAVGVCFGIVFAFIPSVHFVIFYSQSKLQQCIINLVYKKCTKNEEETKRTEQNPNGNIEEQ